MTVSLDVPALIIQALHGMNGVTYLGKKLLLVPHDTFSPGDFYLTP